MAELIVFCGECRKEVTYSVSEQRTKWEHDGVPYIYDQKVAHCSCCGQEVYVPELMDSNLDSLQAAIHAHKMTA